MDHLVANFQYILNLKRRRIRAVKYPKTPKQNVFMGCQDMTISPAAWIIPWAQGGVGWRESFPDLRQGSADIEVKEVIFSDCLELKDACGLVNLLTLVEPLQLHFLAPDASDYLLYLLNYRRWDQQSLVEVKLESSDINRDFWGN